MTLARRRDQSAVALHRPQETDGTLLRLLEERSTDPDFWSLKDRDRTDSAHNIFQYPAMMVPKVQRRLLSAVLDARPDISSIYDPFVGSGTSLVSGMHYGLAAYGNDINPLAVLLSRVRTSRRVEFTIAAIAEHVVARARADRKLTIETSLPNREKWFRQDVTDALSRLRRSIRRCDDLWVRRFLWATLAETVRLTSNDRTSTYKLHARPVEDSAKRQVSPLDIFGELARQNASSISEFRRQLSRVSMLNNGKYQANTEVALCDTKVADGVWTRGSFDLVMTSPPYGDNLTTVTYGQHSYLPLHWIDFEDIDDQADMSVVRTTHELDGRSLGGSIRGVAWTEDALFDKSPALKRFADTLPLGPSDGRSRLLRFYGDFAESLGKILELVRTNSYMIWTVGNRNISGNQVPTDGVLIELLEALGCTLVATLTRQIHHKRMPGRNASSTTIKEEKILLLRKAI